MIIFFRQTGSDHSIGDGRGLEAFGDQPDAQRELPQRDREGADRRERGHVWPEAEQHPEIGNKKQRRSDQPHERNGPSHQAGAIWQGAQQQGLDHCPFVRESLC
jgi:hypothetical protein